MSNEIEEQIIEDIEEKDLVENQELEVEETEEVVEETTEEVSEETEVAEERQPLSDAVLDILLGEKAKKNEAEEDEDEETSEDSEEEIEEDAELEEATEEEEVIEEAKKAKTEDVTDDEEEAIKANDKASDDSVKNIGKLDNLPEVKTKAGYLAASFNKLKEMRKSALVGAFKSLNPVNEEDDEEVAETPKLKADMVNAMYGQLQNMKKDDLVAAYQKIMDAHCEDVNEEVEADHFAEDLKVLAEADSSLTDDFKAKASILFEGAIANKTIEIKEALEAQYTEDLQEEITYVRESLVEKIDSYLSYVVESWIEENQEFVDNKLRTEIAESFMKALQSTFTEHYIEVPDSKVDLVDELAEQVNEAKATLENIKEENETLAKQVVDLSREKIIKEASADLASTQAEKLSSLVEEIEFVNADVFTSKVATIKEGFFNESNESEEVISETVDSADTEIQTIVEGEVSAEEKLPADMAKYVETLSRFNK